ncbi:MAG: hypothetical protein V9G14_07470 [Cypionkella sp.]
MMFVRAIIYQLDANHRPLRLVVTHGDTGQVIGEGSDVGQAGQRPDL